jgi:hypothetical protein
MNKLCSYQRAFCNGHMQWPSSQADLDSSLKGEAGEVSYMQTDLLPVLFLCLCANVLSSL